MHIHFAYYKFLHANLVPGMNQDGVMEALMPEYSACPDWYKDCALDFFRAAPLCGMDRIKRHILIHPSCPVSATIDSKNKGPMVRMVNKNGSVQLCEKFIQFLLTL